MKKRRNRLPRQTCRVCGKEIKQYNKKAKGFCECCKRDIMRQWNQIPFETRYGLLLVLRGNQDEHTY